MIIINDSGYLNYTNPPVISKRNFPLIGWKQLIKRATSVNIDGYPIENCLTENTYQFWRAPSSAAVTVTLTASAVTKGFLGIAAHNLGTHLAKVEVFSGSNLIGSKSVSTNLALMIPLSENVTGSLRVIITAKAGLNTTPIQIAVMRIGEILEIPCAVGRGEMPSRFQRTTVRSFNRSEKGHYLGSRVKRTALNGNPTFNVTTFDWYAEKLYPFQLYAEEHPFFFAYSPEIRPDDVYYCWSTSDFKPKRNRQFVSWSLPFEAYTND